MPSPPQTKTSSAPSSSARSTRSGAYLLFGTSDQIGSSTPARSSVARSSSSPPPIVLPAWAITATFFIDVASVVAAIALRSAAAPAARAAKTMTHERADAHEHAGGDVGERGACRGTSAPSSRTAGSRRASDQSERSAEPATLDPRGEHEQQAAEERDRRGRVAGRDSSRRPAGSRGGATSGRSRWTTRRRRAVRAGLDADHEQRERGEAPVRAERGRRRAARRRRPGSRGRRRASSRPRRDRRASASAARRASALTSLVPRLRRRRSWTSRLSSAGGRARSSAPTSSA